MTFDLDQDEEESAGVELEGGHSSKGPVGRLWSRRGSSTGYVGRGMRGGCCKLSWSPVKVCGCRAKQFGPY